MTTQIKQQVAWVIEFQVNGGSLYFCGSSFLGGNHNAIRFTREDDATKTMNYLLANEMLKHSVKPIVTEHVWMGE